MQNVYMTPLRYTNFNGVEKTTKLHFHLTPRELTDWMVDNKDDADKLVAAFSEMQPVMESNPEGEATTEQKLTMLKLVRILAELSYGKPSEDGEHFDKSDIKKFNHSAAYDGFRMFLFQNPKELVSFIETILNEQVISEFSSRLAEANENGQPAQLQSVPTNGPKDPKDMTHEELVAAMQARNNQ